MGVKVKLPPGCNGFDCKDGVRYTANRPGGTVEVSDRHARAIEDGQFGQTGLVSGKGAESFGTRRGRECPSCHRRWNAWNHECPKCDVATLPV